MPISEQRGAMRGLKVIVLTMAGVALVALGIPWVGGTLLPVAHQATAFRDFDQSVEELWTIVSDPASSASWPERGVARVEIETRDGTGYALTWREYYQDGSDLGFERINMEAPRIFVTRIADEGLPYGGTWTFILDPLEEGGTRVNITEDGEVHSPYFRFIMKFLIGHDETMQDYLNSLQRYLLTLEETETG